MWYSFNFRLSGATWNRQFTYVHDYKCSKKSSPNDVTAANKPKKNWCFIHYKNFHSTFLREWYRGTPNPIVAKWNCTKPASGWCLQVRARLSKLLQINNMRVLKAFCWSFKAGLQADIILTKSTNDDNKEIHYSELIGKSQHAKWHQFSACAWQKVKDDKVGGMTQTTLKRPKSKCIVWNLIS